MRNVNGTHLLQHSTEKIQQRQKQLDQRGVNMTGQLPTYYFLYLQKMIYVYFIGLDQ